MLTAIALLAIGGHAVFDQTIPIAAFSARGIIVHRLLA